MKLLRLPPYHCDLNPIEKVWGNLKLFIRNHNAPDGPQKLRRVEELCNRYFDHGLGRQHLKAFFAHAEGREKFYKELDGLLVETVPPLIVDADDESDDDIESESDSE